MPYMTRPFRLAAGLLLLAGCSSEPVPDPPALVLSGVVMDTATPGTPLPDVRLVAAAYSSMGGVPLAVDSAASDAQGAFRVQLAFDTLVRAGYSVRTAACCSIS
jgi:hypothetical protein